jgi:hypothetical protein
MLHERSAQHEATHTNYSQIQLLPTIAKRSPECKLPHHTTVSDSTLLAAGACASNTSSPTWLLHAFSTVVRLYYAE